MTLLCLGAVLALAIPPFTSADESAHAGYALDVASGELPVLGETVEVELSGQPPSVQYVANHPPLYYVLVAPLLAWGDGSGHDVTGIWAARFATVLLTAGAVVATAVLAGRLVRRRRSEAQVLAAGVMATIPALVTVGATIHNDGLALLTGTVALTAGLIALQAGPRPALVAIATLSAGLTMATRLNGVNVVLVVGVSLAAAGLLHTQGGRIRRAAHGALLGGLPLAASALTSGWFYVRSIRRYGDVTGSTYLKSVVPPSRLRPDNRSFTDFMFDLGEPLNMVVKAEAGGRSWGSTPNLGSVGLTLLGVATAVVAVGGVLALMRGIAAWRRKGRGVAWPARRELVRLAALSSILFALPLMTWVQLAKHVDGAGAPHVRYIFAVLPLAATGVALACLTFSRRWGPLAGMTVVVVQVLLTLMTRSRLIATRTSIGAGRSWWNGLVDAIDRAGLPHPALVLAGLFAGVLLGLVMQGVALWRLHVSPELTDGAVAASRPARLLPAWPSASSWSPTTPLDSPTGAPGTPASS